jgi:hypothetical protein
MRNLHPQYSTDHGVIQAANACLTCPEIRQEPLQVPVKFLPGIYLIDIRGFVDKMRSQTALKALFKR